MLTRRQWQNLFRNPFVVFTILLIVFIFVQFIIQSANRRELGPVKSRVWQTVQALNRAWTVEYNPQDLRNYFHPDMLAGTQPDSLLLVGRDSCLARRSDFAERAKILAWQETDPQIKIYGRGRFAVVTYYWKMDYELDNQIMHASGRDTFSLVREHGRWWIVADQCFINPQH